MRHLKSCLCPVLFLLFLTTPCSLLAQVGNARLEGMVQDPSGAAIGGARILLSNPLTNFSTETMSSAEGFVFPSLPPGSYQLQVEAKGFKKTVIPNLELNVGDAVRQNVKLELGEITETVEVQAPEERVQVADAQIGHTFTLRDNGILPQPGRGPMTLTLFTTGIQVDPGDPSVSRVNGTRMGSTITRLDGINVSDNSLARFLITNLPVNSDSIEASRIITSGSKAEYGRNAGGQIQLVTRRGDNAWHGSLFEYHRNTALNANTFFGNALGLSKPVYIQNTFGGSVGGPIKQDRLFIFANYQGRRNVQQVVRNRLVLTPEARAGLFRWRAPGGEEIQTFDIVANDPRGLGIDPKVAEILKLLPDPNNYDIGDGLNTAGFRFNNPSIASVDDISDDQVTLRADYTAWNGHNLFLRWTWNHPSFIDVVNNGDARFPGQPQATQAGRRSAFFIGSDWYFTPTLLNELRVAFRPPYTYAFNRPARIEGPMLLSNSWTDPLNPSFPSKGSSSLIQVTDNFTLAKGKHTFKAGIEALSATDWKSSDNGIWPDVRFDTTNGNAPSILTGPHGSAISSADRRTFERLYNDLLGRMSQVTQTFYSNLETFQPAGTPRVNTYRYRDLSLFFQDDWKIHPRITLNLGLRYEFFGIPHETSGSQGVVDRADLINSAARFSDLAIKPGGSFYRDDRNNFAPRIGLAWDPAGSGKTVVRAGWGLFCDRLLGKNVDNVAANTPGFSTTVPVYPNAGGGDNRVSDGIPLPSPPAGPQLLVPATRSTDLYMLTPDLRTGYVQQYSLSVQREIFGNTVLEAAYVGSHGVKLFMNLNLNQPRLYEDFLSSFMELQAFQANGTPVSPSNPIVRVYGTPALAVSGLGALIVSQGEAGRAADSMDRLKYASYSPAGVSEFYLRNFPQFNRVIVGTNDGRSYFDSLQVTLRRQEGALKFAANYTFSKSMDNISTDRGFTSPVDNFNVNLNKALSDFDIPHTFNLSLSYTLPIGKNRRFAAQFPAWMDTLIGGWDTGLLMIWQSGRTVTFQSGRSTGPTTDSSYVDYTGDRDIGEVLRRGDGVYWFADEEIARFSFPEAGELGTGGRNTFRGPRFFDLDMSLVKKFPIREAHTISLRVEAYNLFNNANFAPPNANLSIPATFGRISSTVGNPRFLQMALRYDF